VIHLENLVRAYDMRFLLVLHVVFLLACLIITAYARQC
jgi:hypothetical protein